MEGFWKDLLVKKHFIRSIFEYRLYRRESSKFVRKRAGPFGRRKIFNPTSSRCAYVDQCPAIIQTVWPLNFQWTAFRGSSVCPENLGQLDGLLAFQKGNKFSQRDLLNFKKSKNFLVVKTFLCFFWPWYGRHSAHCGSSSNRCPEILKKVRQTFFSFSTHNMSESRCTSPTERFCKHFKPFFGRLFLIWKSVEAQS